jgi:hypothetical protein
MTSTRSWLSAALLLFPLSLAAQTAPQVNLAKPPSAVVADAGTSDAAGDDLARRAFDILAGPAWEKARLFSFTFNVERKGQPGASFAEVWDRATGDYKVSGNEPNGVPFVVIENVRTKSGRAWENGVEVKDAAALQNLLTIGYRRYLNDTYWLLMPLKMLEPGVHRMSMGERSDSCGRTWDVVRVIFDQGPGVPTDVYWAWINRDSGMVEEWDMKLQGSAPDEHPVEVFFHDYRRVAGVLISTRREVKGKNQTVRIDDLKITSEVPKGTFEAK